MSREIKFRAWDPKTEAQIDDKYLAMRLATGALVYASDAAEFGWYDDTDYVLEQFTGLHDKNGVEIYEGDIVIERGRDGRGIPRTVVYEDGMYWLRGPNHTGRVHSIALGGSLADERQARSEVIGNIHENPDLLA
ncbi:putative phage protein (TIGR01671 family) [Rathayibacter sp. PhB127]|uniref:YopX family protein n=1 Tax=Rathayibacter sp. PhB127 TaxID=2485176 RepID=UPI000F4CABB4|nr:YopX family protein [Rathayibacter sp. PhB127]ROS29589.1 putative phage protein (TIGR01671 family) [Rathayibacter sp. PhB127]